MRSRIGFAVITAPRARGRGLPLARLHADRDDDHDRDHGAAGGDGLCADDGNSAKRVDAAGKPEPRGPDGGALQLCRDQADDDAGAQHNRLLRAGRWRGVESERDCFRQYEFGHGNRREGPIERPLPAAAGDLCHQLGRAGFAGRSADLAAGGGNRPASADRSADDLDDVADGCEDADVEISGCDAGAVGHGVDELDGRRTWWSSTCRAAATGMPTTMDFWVPKINPITVHIQANGTPGGGSGGAAGAVAPPVAMAMAGIIRVVEITLPPCTSRTGARRRCRNERAEFYALG